jgi:hypothetical protein
MSDDYDYYSSARWRRDRELIRAVRRNRFDDVRMHLEHGADINAIDKNAWRRVRLVQSSDSGRIVEI